MYDLTETYTVSFFGHRHIDSFKNIEEQLEYHIIKILKEHEYVDFLVGKNGDFDQLVSSTIKRIKKEFYEDNSALILVLPYNSAELRNNENSFIEYYDEIEICLKSCNAHFKNAIQTRNRHIVDRSDLVICYIDHNSGGAYQTIRYARNQKKNIINLAE